MWTDWGIWELFSLRRKSPIFWIPLHPIRSMKMLLRRKRPHTRYGKMTVWLSSASCLLLWAMSFRDNMKAWMFLPYCLIWRSYIENKARLLDMRYLNNCSVPGWMKAHLCRFMSWRWLIWSLVWDSWVLPWMVSLVRIWSCNRSLIFFTVCHKLLYKQTEHQPVWTTEYVKDSRKPFQRRKGSSSSCR